MRNKFLYVCLLLSGFSGLAYQLLWIRLLATAFGSTLASFSTVLAVFFGGLALGSWWSAKKLDSITNPIKFYAYIEGLMAVAGLALYPVLLMLGDFFVIIDPGPGMAGNLLRVGIAAPILLVPTILMGATLPLVCRSMICEDTEVGKGTGLIYGLNTFGAFLGAYFVTFHLLPTLGIFRSILCAVAANAIAGLVSAAFARGQVFEPVYPSNLSVPDRDLGAVPNHAQITTLCGWITLLSGLSFIAIELVWSRLFSIILHGTIYGVGSVLIAILFGLGAGGWIAALGYKRGFRPQSLLLIALTLFGVGSIVVLNRVELIAYHLSALSEIFRAGDVLHIRLVAVVVILLLPSIAIGAVFPLLIQIVEASARRAGVAFGRLYAINTIGCIVGSLAVGFYFLPRFGSNFTATIASGTLIVAVVLAAVVYSVTVKKLRILSFVPVGLVFLTVGYLKYDPWIVQNHALGTHGKSYTQARQAHQKTAKDLAYYNEGRNSTVSVIKNVDRISMQVNGLGQGSRLAKPPEFGLESTLVAYAGLPFLDNTERAFVVGLGAGNTVVALRDLGFKSTRVVELEEGVVEAVNSVFYPQGGLGGGIEIEINDARHSLAVHHAQGGEPYDLIASMPAHPWISNSIFTQEFFDIARKNLHVDGVFVTWFGSSGMDQEVVMSVARAFGQVFPSFAMFDLPGVNATYLVGSMSPLKFDVAKAMRLADEPVISQHPEFRDPMFFALNGVAWRKADTSKESDGPVNTDDSLYVEVQSPVAKHLKYRGIDHLELDAEVWPSSEMLSDSDQFYQWALANAFDLQKWLPMQGPDQRWQQRAEELLKATEGIIDNELLCLATAKYFLMRQTYVAGLEQLAECPDSSAKRSLVALISFFGNQLLSPDQKIPYSPELALAILDFDPASIDHVELPFSAEHDDVVGWLLVRSRSGELLQPEEVAHFKTRVLTEVLALDRHSLLLLASQMANKNNLHDVSTSVRARLKKSADNLGKSIYFQAMGLMGVGDYGRATNLLERVIVLAPEQVTPLEALMKCHLTLGNANGIEIVKAKLRGLGLSAERIVGIEKGISKL